MNPLEESGSNLIFELRFMTTAFFCPGSIPIQ